MAITKEVPDELLKDYKGPDGLTGLNGILKRLIRALMPSLDTKIVGTDNEPICVLWRIL